MWFEVNKPNNLPTHTFLTFKHNNKYYWFEHTFKIYKGIHEFDKQEQLIEFVKNKLLEYAIKTGKATKQDRGYIKYYEYTKSDPNLGIKDYLYHVTHSLNI